MATKSITSTEFQTRAGQYLEESSKAPVIITRHRRPVRVLLDIDEYKRLMAIDTRVALYPNELSAELKTTLEKGYQGRATPELDHLME